MTEEILDVKPEGIKVITEEKEIPKESQPIENKWYKDPMNIAIIVIVLIIAIWFIIK